MAELWFSALTRGLLRRGEFTSRADLAAKITDFAIRYNRTARPYTWTYDARTDHARHLAQARERLQRHMTAAARAANEITDWLKMSALSDFELPGPVREMYFSNIDPAEHSSRSSQWKFVSAFTEAIPSPFHEFIAKVEQILGEANSKLKSKYYDTIDDYAILTASGVITPAQAEKIVQAGKDSSIKYLLTALVYIV
jgi:predicted DCC family thiol-disulfide oxidoreductase YuxK